MRFFKKKLKQQKEPALIVPEQPAFPPDMADPEFEELYWLCKPYTMTSVERLYALYSAVKYVIDNSIGGDFVECGVWKGGSAMMMAGLLKKRNVTSRKLILYDTYEGMSAPTEEDKDRAGEQAVRLMERQQREDASSVWCYSPFEEVKENLQKTGFAEDNIIMIKGKVEDTLPAQLPTSRIALLRLDTDWYESTRHELEYLYPLLTEKGVLLIDDYGHWQGCRKAVDEYISQHKLNILLNRIDETGRLAIKTF